MALGVSEDHLELAASVRGYAERHGRPDAGPARAAPAGGVTAARATASASWRWPWRSWGDALVPGGFLPTVLASAVLARARYAAGSTDTAKLLAGLADGSRSGAVALAPG